jgi:acyl carrier protein
MADGFSASAQVMILDIVQRLLAKRGLQAPADATHDLGDAGLTSLDMVNLMLAIEDKFDIEIPQKQMIPANFRSLAAIERLVHSVAVAA